MAAASFTLDLKKVSACASRMAIKQDYTTVIIGAGLGGLTCGAYLARQGLPVTIVEQNDRPGGYATVFDRAQGKYTFDVSLHATSIHNNSMARTLQNLDILDRIQIAEPAHGFTFKSSDMEVTFAQRDPEKTIQLLSAQFPEEAEGIRSFITEAVAISKEANRYARKGIPLKILFPFVYPRTFRIYKKTLAEMLDEHIKDPTLQGILGHVWHVLGGPPPDKISGAMCAVGLGNWLNNGIHYIKNNSQDLSDAMAESVLKAGGRILYDIRVEKINMENNQISGVTLSDGRTIPSIAVVSNADALTTFKHMLPRNTIPAEYMSKLDCCKPGLSTFVVWLGLNKELIDVTDRPYILVISGATPGEDYKAYCNGEIERVPYYVTISDNLYPGYSQPGTATVSLVSFSGFGPWQTFEADYKNGDKAAYYLEKKRWTDTLLRRAEKEVIPGLTSMIEVVEVATPLTNWRYTGNTNGAILGFEYPLDNALMNRIKNRTPVKGLYLAGAWGSPCGGYAGAVRSGEITFQMMMEDWGA